MSYLYDIPVIPNQNTTINLLDIKAITDIKLVLNECDCNYILEEIFTKKEKKRYRIRYGFTIAFFDESYMQIYGELMSCGYNEKTTPEQYIRSVRKKLVKEWENVIVYNEQAV